MFAAIKDHDGPNDQASRLSRPGVYRLASQRAPTARAFAALRPWLDDSLARVRVRWERRQAA